MRHMESSRQRHSGNIAASGLYPACDDGNAAEKGTTGTVVPAQSVMNGFEQQAGELHQQPIPPYSRELPGDFGHARGELG